jgi:hypothetical protein
VSASALSITPSRHAMAGCEGTVGSHGASEDEVRRGDISDTQPKEERERTSDGRIRLIEGDNNLKRG